MKPTYKLVIFILILSGIALLSAGRLPQASESPRGLTVSFLSVGQGDAILLTTPQRKHILVDGGPDSSVLTRLGEQMWFTERGFDLVVATHNDADHITGIIPVLERYKVERMWINGAVHTTNTYIKLLETIRNRRISTEVVFQGKRYEVDGVTLEALYPLESNEGVRPSSQNSLSIVMRVTYGATRFLLTGDIAEAEEQTLIRSLENPAEALRSDVLKVPHHGSKSGLALNFLQYVHPKYAVIQVGRENRFGHPAASILQKLKDANVQVFRTDQNGTVVLFSDGETVAVKKGAVSP